MITVVDEHPDPVQAEPAPEERRPVVDCSTVQSLFEERPIVDHGAVQSLLAVPLVRPLAAVGRTQHGLSRTSRTVDAHPI